MTILTMSNKGDVIIVIAIVIALSGLLIRSEYKHRYRTFRKNMQRVKLLQETEQVTTTSKIQIHSVIHICYVLILRKVLPFAKVEM